jgi:hypothetical protein
MVFALDDSPTKRFGPYVEGAGTHHNPTPRPAGSKFLYGHVWVCLARLLRHPHVGTIALPILSQLGLVQIWVTLDGVKPSADWPESFALSISVAETARPYIEKS